jgi:hypothetical protein
VAGFSLFLGRRLLEIAVLAWAVTVAAFVLLAGLVSGLRPGSLADRAITATGPAAARAAPGRRQGQRPDGHHGHHLATSAPG